LTPRARLGAEPVAALAGEPADALAAPAGAGTVALLRCDGGARGAVGPSTAKLASAVSDSTTIVIERSMVHLRFANRQTKPDAQMQRAT
jgi:hypothetical protein